MSIFDQGLKQAASATQVDRPNLGVIFNNSPRLLVYLLLLLWTLPLLIGGYEQQSLKVHDEALYATRARLMLDTGDWVNPWLVPHHKTPGIYWLLGTVFRF